MTLSRGAWVKQNGAIGLTAVELRRADAALYYHTVSGTVRSGLLWLNGSNHQLVASASNMSYNLAPVPGLVIGRSANEGAYTLSTQGTTNIATGAAPAAGLSRWDLIYIKQNDPEKSDPDNLPVLGVIQGTAAASPTKPTVSLPVGAYVLAEAQIFSGTTGTNAAPNTVTQVWQYTALVGNPVPVRNVTERATLTAVRTGDEVRRLDLGANAIETWDGAAWLLRKTGTYAEYTNQATLGQIVPAGAQVGPFFQSFPAGRFSVAPIVTLGVSNVRLNAAWNNVTTAGFDLYIRNNDTTTDAIAGAIITFMAKQATATTAAG